MSEYITDQIIDMVNQHGEYMVIQYTDFSGPTFKAKDIAWPNSFDEAERIAQHWYNWFSERNMRNEAASVEIVTRYIPQPQIEFFGQEDNSLHELFD